MVDLGLDDVRVFVHVLAATVWVGGQLVLGGLVPALRRVDPGAPKAAARAFARIAWPAYGVLLLTGVWNVAAVADGAGDGYRAVLTAKVLVVLVSGVAAALHARATSRRGLAVLGALSALTALLALLLGVLLSG
jgi:putative copper export protein